MSGGARLPEDMNVRTSFPVVDEVLAPFGNVLGRDRRAYHNHVKRVLGPGTHAGAGCSALTPQPTP